MLLNISDKNIYAQPIQIAGETYPAILSMKAIHEIEEMIYEPFEDALNKLYKTIPAENGCYLEFDPKYLELILVSCLKAANRELNIEAIINSIHQDESFGIGLQLVDIIMEQLPINVAEYKKPDKTIETVDSGLDWRSMVYFATAHLNWTLEQFWNSTFFMYGAMLEQHLIYHGAKRNKSERKVAKTYEELLENMRNG